jgi:hypothetical protein
VDVALTRRGDLAVRLKPAQEDMKGEVSLTAALHSIDQNIELISSTTKTSSGNQSGVTVTFPIVKVTRKVRNVFFFLLEVDFSIGDYTMKNIIGFTRGDYEKFYDLELAKFTQMFG